jgi:hypothetical protein
MHGQRNIKFPKYSSHELSFILHLVQLGLSYTCQDFYCWWTTQIPRDDWRKLFFIPLFIYRKSCSSERKDVWNEKVCDFDKRKHSWNVSKYFSDILLGEKVKNWSWGEISPQFNLDNRRGFFLNVNLCTVYLYYLINEPTNAKYINNLLYSSLLHCSYMFRRNFVIFRELVVSNRWVT